MKIEMDERLKHRVVGIAVIISIAIIFAPAMMKKSSQHFDNINVAVELPAKPKQPKIAAPSEKQMFKAVKVAHVEIPAEPANLKPLTTIAKAEPLAPINENPKQPELKSEVLAYHVAKTEAAHPVSVVAKLPEPTHLNPAKTTAKVNKQQVSRSKPAPVKAGLERNQYAVQLATFNKAENALSLVQRLKSKGFKQAAFVKLKTGQTTVYKVYVGGVSERQKAQLLQRQLASAVQISGFIVETNHLMG